MTYEKMLDIKLPDKYEMEFRKLLVKEYDLRTPRDSLKTIVLIHQVVGKSYKDTVEYALADTPREKAVAAFTRGNPKIKADILALWLQVVDTMPPIERALEGIDV